MNLPNHANRPARGVIAPRLAIVAGVVVCVVSLIFLTPSRSELFKRYMKDGNAAAAALVAAQGEAGNTDEVTATLTAETIRICEVDGWKGDSLAMLNSFLRNNNNFGPAARETLKHLHRIPAEPRSQVMSALVSGAIAGGDLRLAQEVQIKLIESAEVLTPDLIRQAVDTYRYNSNPGLALVTIDQFEKKRGSLPDDLRELRVVLARETSQPELAFALLSQRVRATTDHDTLRALIPQAVDLGIEAGRQNELIPLYERYLEVVKSTQGESDPRIAEYSYKLAQTYEWTKQPSKAFDTYVELAGAGHRAALDRCLALNPGLFRQDDLMNALLKAREHYREDDKLLLLTARYLGEAARREEAVRFYGEYLARNPKDAEAHFLLAAIHDEAVQLEEALKHFRAAYDLQPASNVYLAKIARLSSTLRKYEEALGYLETLATRTRNRDYVEQYYTLASGMGDTAATKASLRLLIEIGGRLSPTNYIYLASAYRDEGDLSGHLAILKEAVGKYPDNPFIRLDLANAHLFEKRPDRALEVLKGLDLCHFSQGAQAAVNAFTTIDQTPYASAGSKYLQRYGAQLERSKSLTPLEVLQFAEYCKAHGSGTRARRLFNRVLKEAQDPGPLARAHFCLGQYRSARGYQLKYITISAKLTSQDYQLLGDIHSKLGNPSAARSAYNKALSLLKKRTAKPQNR